MASKRFEGRGTVSHGAFVGMNVTINGTVSYGAFVGDGVTLGHGHVGCMADVSAGVVIEAGAYVNGYGVVCVRSVIKSGVTVPYGARIHQGYVVHAILSAGFDSRGYHVIAVLCQTRNDSGPSNPLHWRIMAGCRNFDFDRALAHWGSRRHLNSDILAKVAYLKKAVKIWEKENGKLGCRR